MVDYAAFIADIEFFDSESVTPSQKYTHLDRAVSQLADPKIILNLSRCGRYSLDTEDALRTNLFRIPFAGLNHEVLFPAIAVKSSLWFSDENQNRALLLYIRGASNINFLEDKPFMQAEVSSI
jgi:hypothetical protein